jgi:drug/metabolite transporter (DMT)-like permease
MHPARGAVGVALAANVLGGTSYVLTKVALWGLGEATLVLVRTVVALAILIPLCRGRLGPLLRARGADRWRLLVMGIAGYALPLVLASHGVRHSTATNASLLIATEPLAVVLLGALVLGEPLSGRRLLALGLGVLGTSILVSDGIPFLTTTVVPHPLGDALLVASGVAWALYTIAGKPLLTAHDPVAVSAASLVVAAPVLAVQAAFDAAPLTPGPSLGPALVAACALGMFVSALMTVLWNRALGAMDASHLAAFVFLQPLTGVALSALALGEVLTPWGLVGGGLALAGVAVAARAA